MISYEKHKIVSSDILCSIFETTCNLVEESEKQEERLNNEDERDVKE